MSSDLHCYSSSDPDSAFTLAGSAVGGLGRSLGRGASSRVSWARLSRWAPLLAVFLCGYLSCWLSPPSLAVPRFAPTPPAPALVFPETFRETLLNPSNPWTRPGVIRHRPTVPIKFPRGDPDPELYRRVRWEPAPSDGIHPDYGQGGAESLMEQLADSIKAGVQPEGWEWAVNKTILGVGDSLMRNNVMFFTDHVSHGKFQRRLLPLQSPDGTDWQHGQGMGVVDVPGLGLKVGQWFHQGMIEEELPNFYVGENRPQAFEAKLEHVWHNTLHHPEGLDGRIPDLIIFESLSWDLVFFASLSRPNGDQRFDGRPLDEKEIDWMRGRQLNALRLLRETFPTSKIVLQTAHLTAKSPEGVFSPIRSFQQAEYVESVALEAGLELFDWGRIVSPLSNEMTDGLHFVPGVASWLWGEMALSYLRRAYFHPVNPPPAPASAPNATRLTQKDLAASYTAADLIKYSQPGISTG